MAEFGAITYAAKALRAYGTEIAFVQSEIATAEAASGGVVLTWSTTAAAADDLRVVPFWLSDRNHMAAVTMETTADFATGGIILTLAFGTGQ